MLEAGFPDVIALRCGVVNPIELKAVEVLPRMMKTRILGTDGLSVDQRNWHLSWTKHSGQSLIVLGTGVGAGCKHYVASGAQADVVNDWSLIDWVEHTLIEPASGPAFWQEFTALLGRPA